MTFLEKTMEINKEPMPTAEDIMQIYCPSSFGLEDGRHCTVTDKAKCIECWNREMPNTNKSVLLTMNKETELNIDKKIKEQEEHSYNKGLNDAWELAKRIYEFTCDELEEIFGVKYGFHDLISKYTPQEALAKLKAYEEAQNEIKVGDVVTYAGEKCLVLDIKGDKVVVLTGDGCVLEWHKCDVEKTGKHIELDGLLEQIGE